MHKKVKYINSGHLITTPELFNSIGGFDESLDSGEDYAFGVAAAAAGAEITNNPSLLVVHEGYPKNLQQFIRREIWHGVGECRTLEKLRTSNVAIAAILFMMLHLLAVVGFFYDERFGLAVMFIIVLICTAFAVLKHNARSPVNLLIVSMLYYFYFVSRFLSCVFRNKRIG
jgi:GT2 family glycosyltransferase